MLTSFLRFRYLLVRLLTCPIPYLKSNVPFIGGRSFVEIGAIVAVLVMTMVVFIKIGEEEELGLLTDWIFAVTVVLGLRNNILSILFGVSFERAIYFHKWVAIAALVAMVIHAVDVGANDTGIAIGVSVGVMSLLYLLKPYLFNLFYYFHIISLLFIVPMGFFHGIALIYPITSFLWIIDLMLRYLITLTFRKCRN